MRRNLALYTRAALPSVRTVSAPMAFTAAFRRAQRFSSPSAFQPPWAALAAATFAAHSLAVVHFTRRISSPYVRSRSASLSNAGVAFGDRTIKQLTEAAHRGWVHVNNEPVLNNNALNLWKDDGISERETRGMPKRNPTILRDCEIAKIESTETRDSLWLSVRPARPRCACCLASSPRACAHCGAAEAACGSVALKPRLRCKAAVHCGRECQAARWKAGGHRAVCKGICRVEGNSPICRFNCL